MLFTKRSDYGLRAALELALHHGEGPLSAREIAERGHLPEAFASKLLQDLAAAGVVSAARGRGGGYRLVQPPERLTLRRVVAAFQELAPVTCLGQMAVESSDPEGNCSLDLTEDLCPTRIAWELVGRRMLAVLDSITLADLLESTKERLAAAAIRG